MCLHFITIAASVRILARCSPSRVLLIPLHTLLFQWIPVLPIFLNRVTFDCMSSTPALRNRRYINDMASILE